jgi:hypothetical protein
LASILPLPLVGKASRKRGGARDQETTFKGAEGESEEGARWVSSQTVHFLEANQLRHLFLLFCLQGPVHGFNLLKYELY